MNIRTAVPRRIERLKHNGVLIAAASGVGPVGRRAHRLKRAYGIDYRLFTEASKAHLHLLPSSLDLTGTFVDLGAHVGGWTSAIRACFPKASVLAVEPHPPTFQHVSERFAADPGIRVENVAVDSEPGSATFHVGSAEVFGSLLEFDPAMEQYYGLSARSVDEIMVRTTTLDRLVDTPVSVLKIDVQGAELRAFDGGERTLARTQAVIAEANLADHYQGGSTFASIYDALTRRGFAFWDMEPPYRDDTGRALWVDVAYVRADQIATSA